MDYSIYYYFFEALFVILLLLISLLLFSRVINIFLNFDEIRSRPDKNIINFLSDNYTNSKTSDFDFYGDLILPATSSEIIENFNKHIESHLYNPEETFKNKLLNITLSSNVDIDKKNYTEDKIIIDGLKMKNKINTIFFHSCKISNTIHMKNLTADTLELRGLGHINFIIENCSIRNLNIKENGGNKEKNIIITNSFINIFNIYSNSITNLKMLGGCIMNIKTPPTHADNPFKGDVIFHKVYFRKNKISGKLTELQSQPYRNLREHLLELDNYKTANTIHAVIQEIDLQYDDVFNKLTGKFYRFASNYGSSPVTAISLVLLIWLSVILLVAVSGGVEMSKFVTDSPVGWYQSMSPDSTYNKLTRGIVLSTQNTFSPFTMLYGRGLVIPSTTTVAFISILQSILSPIFLALFIFAVRRRFRLNL